MSRTVSIEHAICNSCTIVPESCASKPYHIMNVEDNYNPNADFFFFFFFKVIKLSLKEKSTIRVHMKYTRETPN